MRITHTTVSAAADSNDGKISSNAWNENHTLTGTANYLLGFDASGNAIDVDPSTIVASAPWGSITGTLSAQTDLQTALDGKQAAGSYLTGNQTITLGGDLSGSGTTSITATIGNGAVTLAKMANMATGSLIYRKTAGSGAPEVNTLATLKADLGLSGTNTGDQDLSAYALKSSIPTLASGTYTPTASSLVNLGTPTVYACQWMRVGNVVTVSGRIDLTPTANATATRLNLSLPVASNFTAAEQAGGAAASISVEQTLGIWALATTQTVRIQGLSSTTSSTGHHFSFTYQVI